MTNELIFHNVFIIIHPARLAQRMQNKLLWEKAALKVLTNMSSKSFKALLFIYPVLGGHHTTLFRHRSQVPFRYFLIFFYCYLFIRCWKDTSQPSLSLTAHKCHLDIKCTVSQIQDTGLFHLSSESWGRICFIIPHAQYYDGLALYQGELEGGKKHFCQWEDLYLLCKQVCMEPVFFCWVNIVCCYSLKLSAQYFKSFFLPPTNSPWLALLQCCDMNQ